MGFQSIKIDDEVMGFLKKHAVPFEDSPNDVLRRLLKMNKEPAGSQGEVVETTFPTGLPKALQQTLEVYALVIQSLLDRSTATNIVARRNNIAPQTVIDKYTRQLGKTAFEIDSLMHPSNASEFKSILKHKYQGSAYAIDKFFNNLHGCESPNIHSLTKPISDVPRSVKKTISRESGVGMNSDFHGKTYTLEELKKEDLGKDTRPSRLKINNQSFPVKTWTDLDITFVGWLYENNLIFKENVPIFNCSHREEKYFINTEPRHYDPEKDAVWKKVGPFFVDTKYNAENHKQNIIKVLEYLHLKVNIEITFV